VHRARRVFTAHARGFQFGGRFLPEMNAIAAGLAGATKLSIVPFVGYGAMSALTWAGGGDRARILSQSSREGDRGSPERSPDRPLLGGFRALSAFPPGPPPSCDSPGPAGSLVERVAVHSDAPSLAR